MAAPPPPPPDDVPAPPPAAPSASSTSSVKPAKKWVVDIPVEKDWKDLYPFHAAAQGGQVAALRAILATQRSTESKEALAAFINAYDNDKWTALQYASWEGHMDVIKELVPADGTPLASLALANPGGATPLHLAAGTGRLEVVQYLLAHGADRSLVNHDKQKAIDFVKQLQPDHTAELLKLLA